MKKTVIILIAAFGFIAVGLMALMVALISRGGSVIVDSNRNMKLVNTETVSMEGIDSIQIKCSYDDVIYYASDNNDMIIKEYKNFTPNKDELARISKGGSKLTIHGDNGNYHWISNRNGYIEVYLPSKYAGVLDTETSSGNISSDLVLKLAKFRTDCSSGDVTMNEIEAEEINSSASSGNITIQKAQGIRKISTTSGDIEVYSGDGDSNFSASSGNITIEKASGLLKVNTNSGDIEIHDSIGNKELESSSGYITLEYSTGFVKASASSGDISMTKSKGAAQISTTSGLINLELSEVTDDIDLEASSGDVSLQLPKEFAFDFSAKTSSGDIDTSFDDNLSYNEDRDNASGRIGTTPDKKVKINTTSGDISVSTKN